MNLRNILVALCLSLTTLCASGAGGAAGGAAGDNYSMDFFSGLSLPSHRKVPSIVIHASVSALDLPEAYLDGTELRLQTTRDHTIEMGKIIKPPEATSGYRLSPEYHRTPLSVKSIPLTTFKQVVVETGEKEGDGRFPQARIVIDAGRFSTTVGDTVPSVDDIAPVTLQLQIIQTKEIAASGAESATADASGSGSERTLPGEETIVCEGTCLIPPLYFSEGISPLTGSEAEGAGAHTVRFNKGLIPSVEILIEPDEADAGDTHDPGVPRNIQISAAPMPMSAAALAEFCATN